MLKLIVFDFDGVIIEGSNEGYFRCYHKALEAVGVSLSPKEERQRILDEWGKGYIPQLEYLLKEKPEALPIAIKAYEKCYRSPVFYKDIKLIEGARESLERLSKQYNLAIATGMIRASLENLIKKFEINFFKKILTVDDIKRVEDRKPSPFILNGLLKYFKISKDETAYVGDSERDVQTAKNAGIRPIVVLTGHLTKDEAEKLGVKHIIQDINHLEDKLTLL